VNRKPINILIIDDNRSLVETMTDSLKLEEFGVESAFDGKAGLGKIKSEKPDVVLLDVKLPDIDGFEVLHQIRANSHTEKLPVILITADTTLDIEKGFSEGANDCIIKPINMQDLEGRIRELVREKQKILITDDDRQICDIIKKVLIKQHYEAEVVYDGESCIETASREKPDLILLDISFAFGPDGIETCRKLKENPKTKKIPIIMLTANEYIESVEKCFVYGAEDYIFKPFYIPDLVLKIKKFLDYKK
jgi:DNA-binding response OmpR family regulator